MNHKCLRCNSENFEKGILVRGNRTPIRLHLDAAPKFGLFDNDLDVHCVLCMDCGHIELLGDHEKAQSFIQR